MEEYPDTFAFSVSHTTRKPRPGEHEGIHYHFVERPHMEQMIQAGEFFEHAQFGGNIYGTSKKAVEEVRASGKICVLDVELQGVHNFKRAGFDAKYILIQPPSIEVLKSRLEQRGTENTDSMQKRLKHAQEDMEAVAKEPHLFDKVVINDNFERAYMDFLKAIRPELDEFHKQQATNPGKCCASASGVDLTMPKTAPIIEDGIGVDAN